MNINENIKAQIKNHALQDPSKECCGFLVLPPKSFNLKVIKANNVSDRPEYFFKADPRDYLRACDEGEIKFIYHSHIEDNSEFSNNDKLNSKKHEIDYLLYNIKADNFFIYGHKRNSVADITKPFKWGTNDCFTTVRDYLKESIKKELVLPKWYKTHDEHWLAKHPLAVEEVIKLNPILKNIDFHNEKQLQQNDIICFTISRKIKVEDHFGVYLGNSRFYHLPMNKFPITQDLGEFYSSRITSVYRPI